MLLPGVGCIGGQHAQAAVQPFAVVDVGRLRDQGLGHPQAGQGFVQPELVLEDAVDALGDSVLVGVVLLGGREDEPHALGKGGVVRAAVLQAPVAVVDHALPAVHSVGVGHSQGLLHELHPHVVLQRVAHDFLGVGIGDQGQVGMPLIRFDVGDVADEHLLGLGDLELLDAVRRFVEVVLGVGSDVESLGFAYLQPPASEQVEELVPPHADAQLPEPILQHQVELLAARPFLPLPDPDDPFRDPIADHILHLACFQALVVGLLAYPE